VLGATFAAKRGEDPHDLLGVPDSQDDRDEIENSEDNSDRSE
jgi:hypothetical protein